MKNYTITVNGNVYDVTVEENGSASAPVAAPRRAAAPVAAPKAAPAPAPAPKAAAGAKSVVSPLPGSVIKVIAKVGDEVKRGQAVMVIESMKMENNIPAPRDGKVTAIHVSAGNSVMQGDALIDIE